MALDRFLLAENPMRLEQGGMAIIHTLDPVSIIEVLEGHHAAPADTHQQWFTHEYEQYTLRLRHLFTTDIGISDDEAAAKAAHVIARAWRWFRAYMEWEDSQQEL